MRVLQFSILYLNIDYLICPRSLSIYVTDKILLNLNILLFNSDNDKAFPF